MNNNNFLNKWWLMLVQELLFILLSYFLFNQAVKLIIFSASIAGFIALLTGLVSIIGYFFTGKNERHWVEFFTGFFSCIAGIFFLSSSALVQVWITWIFAVYMILNAILVVVIACEQKTEISWWWGTLIFLLFTLMVLYFFINNTTVLNISIGVFAGVQFFINGILIIVLAFVIRKLQIEYSQTISQIRNKKTSKGLIR